MTRIPDSADLTSVVAPEGIPQVFWWRGQRYRVQRIVMYWIETGPWWHGFHGGVHTRDEGPDVTWHIWRIEAHSDHNRFMGDVAHRTSVFVSSAFPWRVVRVLD
jgi:hypothetical protein